MVFCVGTVINGNTTSVLVYLMRHIAFLVTHPLTLCSFVPTVDLRRVIVALKCISELQDQQNALEAKVTKELTTLSNSLKHPSKDPQNSNEIQNQQNSLDKRLKYLKSKLTTEAAQTSQE